MLKTILYIFNIVISIPGLFLFEHIYKTFNYEIMKSIHIKITKIT